MNIKPSPITAALAGVFAGAVMPMLWARFAADSTSLILAFLLVVALPAHAFVAGFNREHAASASTVDTVLLKRITAWLLSAVIAAAIAQAFRA